MGTWGEGVTERVRTDAPGYAAEYQAGAIDLNDTGYEKCRELTGPETDPAGAPASSNPAVQATARANPDTGTQFVLVRHTDRSATTGDAAVLDWTTPDGRYRVPVRVEGRDAQILVGGLDLGGQRLVYST